MKSIFANLDIGNWLYGLFAAVVGGGATAVVAAISINQSDPHYLNTVGRIFLTSAAFSAFMYLKQKPLPEHIVSKTTTTLTVEKVEAKPDQGK